MCETDLIETYQANLIDVIKQKLGHSRELANVSVQLHESFKVVRQLCSNQRSVATESSNSLRQNRFERLRESFMRL